jgi:hypothetical protein
MWKLGGILPTTHSGIEYPLPNLESRKSFELIAHTLQNNTATAANLATDQHSFSMPRVLTVLHLTKNSFMDVAYLGCTIRCARTLGARLQAACPRHL